MEAGKCVHTLSVMDSNHDDQQHIIHMSLCNNRRLLSVVTYDHNILLYDLKTLKLYKQVCEDIKCSVPRHMVIYIYINFI